ncbi:transposase-like protein, partial [mine drainage metagenome]
KEENRKIVDGLNRRIVEFEKENRRLVDENSKQREELEEYRKRHPATVGVKNGKTYDVRPENAATGTAEGTKKRKQGAQPGHKGHFRKTPKITDRIAIHAKQFQCPECSSPLVRRGFRKRVIEDIPPVTPRIVQYRIERMYCTKCRKFHEPEIDIALPGATLSIRAMLIVAFFK